MQKLYDANGYIRINLIKKALEKAKREGELRGVPTYDFDDFAESLEKEIENFPRVGSKINKSEMEFLFRQLEKNHSDKISPSELEIIKNIILNDDYEIG